MFSVILDRAAQNDLHKIPVEIHEKIFIALKALQENSFRGKYLRGRLHGHYSLRVWPYRIIYKIYKEEQLIQVIRIGHRQGVYR